MHEYKMFIQIFLTLVVLNLVLSGFSLKKGLAHNDGMGQKTLRISELNVSWFYTWTHSYPQYVPPGSKWVPMLWGRDTVTDDNVKGLTDMATNGIVDSLLGFNEPDFNTQSNMSVDEAISLWPKLMSTGLRLGSPAVAFNYDWLDDFMTKARNLNYRVDFM